MANFDSLNPATFGVSKSNFPGNYYYTIAVTPKNPASYSGPPFYTVTSNTLLTDEEIISNAIAIASSRRSKSDPTQVLEFNVIAGTVNMNIV